MAIKRYHASLDNTITNAFRSNLTDRGMEGNMGESDILEIFSLYAQVNTSSIEKSRVIIQFPTEKLYTDRLNNKIPAPGSVSFLTKLFNARHGQTTAEKYFLSLKPIVRDWEEGFGLDMEEYNDKGASNWMSGSTNSLWYNEGGDYIDQTWVSGSVDLNKESNRDIKIYKTYVTGAADDIKFDISDLVEEWMIGEEGPSAATTSIVISGGTDADRKTALANAATTFKLTDASGNSQVFTFSTATDANTGGVIGIQSDSNTTQIAASIRSAINSLHSLRITAEAAVATGDADSAMTMKLVQQLQGKAGNTLPVVSAAATNAGLSVGGFITGAGLTKAVVEVEFKSNPPIGSTIKLYSTDGQFRTYEFGTTARNGEEMPTGHCFVLLGSAIADTAENFKIALSNQGQGSITVKGNADANAVITALNNKTLTLVDSSGLSQKFTFDATFEEVSGSPVSRIGIQNDSNVLQIAQSIKLAIDNANGLGISASAPVAASSGDNASDHTIRLLQDVSGPSGETAISTDVNSSFLTSSDFVGHGHPGKFQISSRTSGGSTLLALTQSVGGFSGNSYILPSNDITTNHVIFPLDASNLSSFSGGDGLKNYGFGIMLSGNYENPTGSLKRSFYTKKFFARGSEYFFKRPIIEAQWDSSFQDDRSNFYISSSLVSAKDNLNTLVFYNYAKGNLVDVPNLSNFTVSLYGSVGAMTASILPAGGDRQSAAPGTASVGRVGVGVYTSSLCFKDSDPNISELYDVWSVNGSQVLTGSSIKVKSQINSLHMDEDRFLTKITNLKPEYFNDEVAKFRVFTRKKGQNLNIYTVSSNEVPSTTLPNSYFSLTRASDNDTIIPYSTGSVAFSKLSYDSSGSYFDLDMSMLESDYSYEIRFLYEINNEFKEQEEVFKFRVK